VTLDVTNIARKIEIATGIVRKLEKVWKASDISSETKVYVYHTLVQSILLYNAETWTLREDNKRTVRVFEMSVLRRILRITRRARLRNIDIRNELHLEQDIVDVIQTRRLTYFGHVVRMNSSRYPNVMLYGHTHGTRPVGRPKKQWLDNVSKDCSQMGLSLPDADKLARDRRFWRSLLSRRNYRVGAAGAR